MYRNQSGNRKALSKLNNAGISLVEILVTIAILGVVGGIVIGFLQSGTKSYQNTDREVDMQYDAQVLLNQVGDYVINANSGLKQKDNTVYIYNTNENTLETEILSWDSQEQILYYEKTEKVNETESPVVDKTVLSKNVSQFSVDLAKADAERKVNAELTLQKDQKTYEATATWNLRNSVAVSVDTEDTDTGSTTPVVDGVKVFSSETQIWPGEEQLFYASVLGSNNPSQQVVWFLEGDSTSEDTYIDDGGILHVGEDETAAAIKVAAQSSQDPTKRGTLDVQIHNEKIRITPEEVWLGAPVGYRNRIIDPDSYGTDSVELSAEVLGDNATELENVSWACDVNEYQTSMAEQTEDLKKTLTLSSTQKHGKITVRATGTDSEGNTVTSNDVVIHVVSVDINPSMDSQQTEICLQADHGTRMYIYGMEDVAADDIKVADSFDDIKNNTGNCRFYIYDSREVLYYYHFNPEAEGDKLGKLESGAWQELVEFHPEFSIWDRLFLNPESKYTCIGIYKAGELNKKTDKAGESCYFGFSVIKVGLKK